MENNQRMTRGEKKLRRKKIVSGTIAFALVFMMILAAISPLIASL